MLLTKHRSEHARSTRSNDVYQVLEQPTNVTAVKFTGNEVTKEQFLQTQFKHVQEAKTYGEVQQKIMESMAELQPLELFESIHASIDKVQGGDADVQVLVDLKEKRRVYLETGAYRDASGENEVVRIVCDRCLRGCALFPSPRHKCTSLTREITDLSFRPIA